MPREKVKIVEKDPFSVEAMKLAKSKLLSSEVDRSDSKKFLKELNSNGYLILYFDTFQATDLRLYFRSCSYFIFDEIPNENAKYYIQYYYYAM